MLRVAVIIGKMDSGGKKNLVMEYYRHIDRKKIQFDFICDSDSQAIPEEEIKKMGGRVYQIRPYPKIIQNMVDMSRLFKANQYKVVHAYNSTMNVFPMFVARICGVPVRISESLSMAHKKDTKTKLKKILRLMSRWFANYYMCCGGDCGRWQFGNKLFDQGRVDVYKTVINTEYNSFCPQLRQETRKLYGWQDKIVIGHIGRFTSQKNSVRVIEIFAAIAEREENAVLCLIGDGELKKKMFEKIEQLNILNRVCYLGRREDIQQFYNAMDAFLLPSLYEGLPVVGLEAESCGLPVFFSTEITREANACELGHFLSLDETEGVWAEKMIKEIKKNITHRRSHANEVKNAGFDSANEAKRLQMYYMSALKKELDK